MSKSIHIHEDISKASTLPGWFYREATAFEQVKEKVFSKIWHYAADEADLGASGSVFPLTILPGVLDEPLVFTKNTDGQLHCLSNVCTHRGKVLVENACNAGQLRCGYHGRCFHLDGHFKSMPMFDGVENFPTEKDDLTKIAFAKWAGMLFTALQPSVAWEEMIRPMQERLSWLPLDTLEFVPDASKDYLVKANWALYCDNYLEGFHIPFVHPALNQVLDFKNYHTEIFPFCNLQVGVADEGEPHFSPPENSPDYGKKIYAYYWWVFPNLMFNFYPWGLSLNVVEPQNHQLTKVRFRSYRFKNQPFDWAQNQLDQTEIEDESVVESVQQGIQSRFYDSGRYSVKMEKGVHHFHLLLSKFFNGKSDFS